MVSACAAAYTQLHTGVACSVLHREQGGLSLPVLQDTSLVLYGLFCVLCTAPVKGQVLLSYGAPQGVLPEQGMGMDAATTSLPRLLLKSALPYEQARNMPCTVSGWLFASLSKKAPARFSGVVAGPRPHTYQEAELSTATAIAAKPQVSCVQLRTAAVCSGCHYYVVPEYLEPQAPSLARKCNAQSGIVCWSAACNRHDAE